MLKSVFSNQFRKDVETVKKRGLKSEKLQGVMNALCKEEILPQKYRVHMLIGTYGGHYECHVQPDWLLIYKIIGDEIYFVRTGTHSDLF